MNLSKTIQIGLSNSICDEVRYGHKIRLMPDVRLKFYHNVSMANVEDRFTKKIQRRNCVYVGHLIFMVCFRKTRNMKSNEFYAELQSLKTSTYSTVGTERQLYLERKKGKDRGVVLNPVTLLASYRGLSGYRNTKTDTIRAGKDLGLTRSFTESVYNATLCTSNRGNIQVVRGKLRSALEI